VGFDAFGAVGESHVFDSEGDVASDSCHGVSHDKIAEDAFTACFKPNPCPVRVRGRIGCEGLEDDRVVGFTKYPECPLDNDLYPIRVEVEFRTLVVGNGFGRNANDRPFLEDESVSPTATKRSPET
jgi:hypothetical protein